MNDERYKMHDANGGRGFLARMYGSHRSSFIFHLSSFLLCLSLTACGFHPRGDVALPKYMDKTYIQGAMPYSDLETDLHRALTNSGAQVIDTPQDATAQLRILHDEFGRRVLTVAVTGKPSEYEIFYTVDFEVTGADGKSLLSHQSQTLTRDFTFDETQLLGKANEEDLLHGEMRHEMVQRILRSIEHASVK
jgi:LPS-assembly lipoprotein